MENYSKGNDSDLIQMSDTQFVDLIYPPVLIIIGVIFNILIIVVMRTRFFHEQSTSVFMTMGATNDTLSLMVSMLSHWLYVAFPEVYSKEKAGWICKFLDFYGWGNCDLGILITTSMTIDRAFAISFPLRMTSGDNVKRAKITIGIVTLIVVAKEFHFLIGSDMVYRNQTERLCNVFTTTASYKFFWEDVWPWLHFSFLLVCFVIMTISNGILTYFVWKSSNDLDTRGTKVVKRTSVPIMSHQKVDQKWRTITPMLIGESCALLFLTFPFTVQSFFSEYHPTFYQKIEPKLLFSVTFYMLYTNKCITFIIYIVTGSRFRQALKECIIICFKGRGAVRRIRFREHFVGNVNIIRSVSEGKDSSVSNKSSTQSKNADFYNNDYTVIETHF
ncbi:galanin receptor type 1-like [Ylistrum balloti]|uniref:galanin receptor type 1-like n=1 Tax=Ylistrum balloti TaxID=509963 RepID=UPI0029058BA9|nr:galanin receptor type 1-like [Ylistrum balloti]